MSSTATKLQQIADDALIIAEDVAGFSAAKDSIIASIEAKDVAVPDGAKLSDLPALIDSIEAGGGGTYQTYPVYFISVKGEILSTQYIEEGSSAIPPNAPVIPYAQFAGWLGEYANVTKESYIFAEYHPIHTDTNVDGDTVLSIIINVITGLNTSITFTKIDIDSTTINWGDGTTSTTTTIGAQTITHTYAAYGTYDIIIGFTFEGFHFASKVFNTYQTQLISAVIGNHVTVLGNDAFNGCTALQYVILLYINTYGSSTFKGCVNIKSMVIRGVPMLSNCFADCKSLKYVYIKDGAVSLSSTSYYQNHFAGDGSLLYIRLPNGLLDISMSCFSNCTSLTSIDIPSSVTQIKWSAFEKCNALENVKLSDNLVTLDGQVFVSCYSLRSLRIPSTVRSFYPFFLFQYCYALESIEVPASVLFSANTIPSNMFAYCFSFKEFTIPASITTIGTEVFYGCTSMQKLILLRATPPTLAANLFSTVPDNFKILVPPASVAAYKAATNWVTWANYIYANPN